MSLRRSASLVKHNNSLGGRNKVKSSLGSDLHAVLHLASRWVNLGHSEDRADPSYVPRGQLPPAARGCGYSSCWSCHNTAQPPPLRKWDTESANWIRKNHCQRAFSNLSCSEDSAKPPSHPHCCAYIWQTWYESTPLVPVLFRRGISHAEGVQLSMVVEWGLSSPSRRGGVRLCVSGGLSKNKLCLWSQRVPEQWNGRGGCEVGVAVEKVNLTLMRVLIRFKFQRSNSKPPWPPVCLPSSAPGHALQKKSPPPTKQKLLYETRIKILPLQNSVWPQNYRQMCSNV